MKVEHVAFNVTHPVAMAEWYCKHCGFRIVKHVPELHQAYFLADESSMMIEIYHNPAGPTLDLQTMKPLTLHLALVSAAPDAESKQLIAAGAVFVEEIKAPDGTHIIMLRDPWGLALQLCKRAASFAR
jgi:glyoxylase I family protein